MAVCYTSIMNIPTNYWRDFAATVLPHLDERRRRIVLAAQARLLGRGGVSMIAKATGISRPTIYAGMEELDANAVPPEKEPIRKKGGGRKSTAEVDLTLQADLEKLVEPVTRGDPESPLR